MPLVQTRGAASAQGFGEFAQATVANYIEEMFSTYLYTGNNSTQTITNNIDLSTKGGLVWIKNRSTGSTNHALFDTIRGAGYVLSSNTTAESQSFPQSLTSFNANGFSLNYDAIVNDAVNFVSWSFRKQPKFFTTVSYTGNGGSQNIAHNLGSVPGFIITKRTSTSAFRWRCYHRSLGNTSTLNLDLTGAVNTGQNTWDSTTPTASVFSLGADPTSNGSGETYVAYLFAHNAGGFGLTGTDNVISCGSFTTDGSGSATVSLGYEPQWVMIKRSDASDDWIMLDVMRGMSFSNCLKLAANASSAEYNFGANQTFPTATGFIVNGTLSASATYIYIAIRRGPMKVPTLGTSVYNAIARTGTGANATVTGVGFPSDWVIAKMRTGDGSAVYDRLRGNTKELCTSETAAEYTITDGLTSFASMDGVSLGADATNGRINFSARTYIDWLFRRAPSFFDEVCYTGTGSATTFSHNLTVAPQMMIVKRRSGSADWTVYHVAMGATKYTFLDGSTELTGTMWNNTTPTSSVFSVDDSYYVNYAANTYVAYLFATLAGVSKVGSYTGTGALQTVNCGFTTGARFVLIHRIDSGSNDWFVYDSARGITSGNDPYLALNNTAAEVTGTNYVDTDTTGFKVTAAAPSGLNASGGTYIFLAIA